MVLLISIFMLACSSEQASSEEHRDEGPTLTSNPFSDADGDGVIEGRDNCPAGRLDSVNPVDEDTGVECLPGDDCVDPEFYIDVPPGSGQTVHVYCECIGGTFWVQADHDHDGIGDPCDVDDNDNVLDKFDNCRWDANSYQTDSDGDGDGDVCDPDDDNDGVGDDYDNCPFIANTDQVDFDNDGVGDICDMDCNGDGVDEVWHLPNMVCWTNDLDQDGYPAGNGPGEDCNDGNYFVNPEAEDICDGTDNNCNGVIDEDCENTPVSECESNWDCVDDVPCTFDRCLAGVCQHQLDDCDDDDPYTTTSCNTATGECEVVSTVDCLGDEDCDDGVACSQDLCGVLFPGACSHPPLDCDDHDACTFDTCEADGCHHVRSDTLCPADQDGDGVIEGDNCPAISNPDQSDIDRDGAGDVCDSDMDGDDVLNTDDNCVPGANPEQEDVDRNQIGDACEDVPCIDVSCSVGKICTAGVCHYFTQPVICWDSSYAVPIGPPSCATQGYVPPPIWRYEEYTVYPPQCLGAVSNVNRPTESYCCVANSGGACVSEQFRPYPTTFVE